MDSPPRPGSLRAREIVGREWILERLEDVLEAGGGGGQVVGIAGEAGLGKTRLIRGLRARAEELGRTVLEGRATPLEAALPLGVLQDALRDERRTSPTAAPPDDPLAAAFPALVLPELRAGTRAAETDRGVLFEAASRYLRARSAPAGLVLVLEDLHWADPTSHALVAYLARTTRDAPIVMALTYRLHEGPAGGPLDGLRHELARERLAEEIALAPLDVDEVALMLVDILGVAPERTAREFVARVSGGNPFVVEELVRDAVAGGRLDLSEHRWRLDEPLSLPDTVQEMLLRRVRALGAADGELLSWAAVLGERFDPAVLAVVGDVPEREAIDALRRLREAGLVADARRGADGRLAFRHALTREAVLSELLDPERRRRHARVLEVAEAPAGGRPALPLEELLGHAVGAGDRERSLGYSIAAAERSADLGGYQEALAQCDRALALWRPEDGTEVRAGLLMWLGYLTSAVGGGAIMWMADARSGDLFAEARTLYEELGDHAAAALALAGVAWARESTDVVDELREARAGLGPDAPGSAVCQVLSRLAERELLVGYARDALRTSGEGLALLARPEAAESSHFLRSPDLRFSFRLTAATARWSLGDAGGRASLVALGGEALARNDHLWAVLALHQLCRYGLDRPSEAGRHADRAIELAGRHGLSSMAGWLAHLRAAAHVHAGEWEAAEAVLKRAEALHSGTPGQFWIRPALRIVRGELALARGELAVARETLEPVALETDLICGRIMRRMARVTLARTLLATGDAAAARAALLPLTERWTGGDEGPFLLSALLPMAVVEVAGALDAAEEAARWSAELRGLGSGSRADYACALADLAAGRRPLDGAIEDAALAVERDGCRTEGAWMAITGAGAAMRAGEADLAAELAAAALARFRGLGADGWCRSAEGLLRRLGRRAPTRGPGPGAGGLTARELEVLALVAEGLTNRGIAERLVISPGTAGRHVANLFAKLGAHSRVEAARLAVERGLLDGDPM